MKILIALLLFTTAYGAIEPILEVKGGYFMFTNEKMRKVYGGGYDLQLSGTAPIWNWVQLYVSAEYLQASGHSLGFNQRTSLWQLPINVGLRGSVKLSSQILYYATLGPRYFFLHAENHSHFVESTICHHGIGGFANTGFTFRPCNPNYSLGNVFIDIYAEYSYEHMHRNPSKEDVFGNSVQVGGFSFGGGVGYAF